MDSTVKLAMDRSVSSSYLNMKKMQSVPQNSFTEILYLKEVKKKRGNSLKRERAEKVAPIEKSKFWMKISEKY